MYKPPVLIGVDPSFTATGVSLFQNNILKKVHLIKPSKKSEDRLQDIAMDFQRLLEILKPEAMAIETQYLSIISSSVIKVIEVKGVLEGIFYAYMFRCGREPVIIDVAPSAAKKAVGVHGRLKRGESKKRVAEAVLRLYPDLDGQSQDVMDSVAIGLEGLRLLSTIKT